MAQLIAALSHPVRADGSHCADAGSAARRSLDTCRRCRICCVAAVRARIPVRRCFPVRRCLPIQCCRRAVLHRVFPHRDQHPVLSLRELFLFRPGAGAFRQLHDIAHRCLIVHQDFDLFRTGERVHCFLCLYDRDRADIAHCIYCDHVFFLLYFLAGLSPLPVLLMIRTIYNVIHCPGFINKINELEKSWYIFGF